LITPTPQKKEKAKKKRKKRTRTRDARQQRGGKRRRDVKLSGEHKVQSSRPMLDVGDALEKKEE
jgi:hypothetical protein